MCGQSGRAPCQRLHADNEIDLFVIDAFFIEMLGE